MARHPGNENGQRVDATDMRIIKELQEDGRRTYGKVGSAVGLSDAAVRQRVQRMVETEAIRIVAVTDPALAGVKTRATIGIRAEGDLNVVGEAIAAIPDIDYIVITAGSFDLLAEAQCRDDARLLEIVNDGIRRIAGVTGTEIFVYLKMVKQTYPWPPN